MPSPTLQLLSFKKLTINESEPERYKIVLFHGTYMQLSIVLPKNHELFYSRALMICLIIFLVKPMLVGMCGGQGSIHYMYFKLPNYSSIFVFIACIVLNFIFFSFHRATIIFNLDIKSAQSMLIGKPRYLFEEQEKQKFA